MVADMMLDDLPIRPDLLQELFYEELGTLSPLEAELLHAMGGIHFGCDDGSSVPAREEAA